MPVAADKGRIELDSPGAAQQTEDQRERVRRVLEFVSLADDGEEERRLNDRVGANLYYGRHWNVDLAAQRAQITANITKSLIEHKLSIMLKQLPIPIVEAGEAGDSRAADLMRRVIMGWWYESDMQEKLREACTIANNTRTCALKFPWDPTIRGGAGDVACDVVPGWRLILDPRAKRIKDMEFVGHREIMRRSKVAKFYPKASRLIFESKTADKQRGSPSGATSMPASPIGSAYDKSKGGGSSFGTIVNGRPVISAFSNGRSTSPQNDGDESVQVIELFYRDDTLYETTEKDYDPIGNPRKEVVRDDEGMPLFDTMPDEIMDVDGQPVAMPTFKLRYRDIERTVLKPKYPYWRRTTVMYPGEVELDDIAWDGPAPYALVSDGIALEGPHVRGSALDCEDLQISLNVTLSLMMDNWRLSAMRALLAGAQSGLEQNSLMVGPADVIRVGDINQVKWLDVPPLGASDFTWINLIISLMERIVGATGIMQGESAGRVDSAAGYDILAEIGGSRMVTATQQMEVAIADAMEIVGWYAQRYYTEAHAIAVEDAEGNQTFERVSSPFLYGTFRFKVLTGSTMAWSESSVRARLMADLQAGIIDKIEFWKRTNTPNWQQIRDRILVQNPILSGASASPPPRTRTTTARNLPGGNLMQ